jgi:RNA polymerase sigma-70 factor (ECF subfamily)
VHSFESVYSAWFDDVARAVRVLGANEADVEDVTQEVFIIVQRKLGQFDGRDLRGFLYRITERTVRDHRRSAWIRRVFCNLSPLSGLPAGELDAVDAIHRGEQRRLLDTILARMSEKRRTTFVLFAIEGYNGEEIGTIQSLPEGTVWTRLHRARKDFMRLVADLAPAERETG